LIASPPVAEGAIHEIVACPAPGMAETCVGAPEAPTGTTAAEASDDVLVPMSFVDVTLKV